MAAAIAADSAARPPVARPVGERPSSIEFFAAVPAADTTALQLSTVGFEPLVDGIVTDSNRLTRARPEHRDVHAGARRPDGSNEVVREPGRCRVNAVRTAGMFRALEAPVKMEDGDERSIRLVSRRFRAGRGVALRADRHGLQVCEALQAGSSRANLARSVLMPTAAKRTTSFVSSSSASTLMTLPDAELRVPHAHARLERHAGRLILVLVCVGRLVFARSTTAAAAAVRIRSGTRSAGNVP